MKFLSQSTSKPYIRGALVSQGFKTVAGGIKKGAKKIGQFVDQRLDNIEARAKFDEEQQAAKNMVILDKNYPGRSEKYFADIEAEKKLKKKKK